eukprot:NODE_1550_length_2440_cov_10.504972.p1 GENE.NODE_1550_length_2440_cov_10.504972~~NODE_1550_length_2440_cov_10.504972.p1  ORF type:complete len:639 (+),score=187.30 NODE_1550_length_2440_cov_10.504972:39-1919(+)
MVKVEIALSPHCSFCSAARHFGDLVSIKLTGGVEVSVVEVEQLGLSISVDGEEALLVRRGRADSYDNEDRFANTPDAFDRMVTAAVGDRLGQRKGTEAGNHKHNRPASAGELACFLGRPTPNECSALVERISAKCGSKASLTVDEKRAIHQLHQQHAFFVVDGGVYDLLRFIPLHPGGRIFFKGELDLSTELATYHNNVGYVRQVLERYAVKDLSPDDIPFHTRYPEWLPPLSTLPKYDFSNAEHLVPVLRKRINGDASLRMRIKRADLAFDVAGAAIFALHLFLMFPALRLRLLPSWLLVVLLTATRTSLSAVGHYHTHRAKNDILDWGDAFFDMQYVGQCIITWAGHVRAHHMRVAVPNMDPKATVFTAAKAVPRLYRVPAYTLLKFGHLTTGALSRWFTFHFVDVTALDPAMPLHKATRWSLLKHTQFFTIRLLLLSELGFCVYMGRWRFWLVQFTATVWVNLFLIVSSHEFEAPPVGLGTCKDWGVYQVLNSFDIFVTGNRWVDSFLSAGLSCHRVHHALPNMRSGWSNLIVEPIVREICEREFGIEWRPSKGFFQRRVIELMQEYLFSPAYALETYSTKGGELLGGDTGSFAARFLKEHLSVKNLWTSLTIALQGFGGFGI